MIQCDADRKHDEMMNPGFRTVSGRRMVAAMFSLGILATAFLWTYWTVRMTPFMPLQEALEQEFPSSSPRVEGGTIKKTKESLLTVVLRTDFDPTVDTAASRSGVSDRLERTRVLATQLANLTNYEVLALHLYLMRKEQGISQKTFFRQVAGWTELDAVELIGWEPDPARKKPPDKADYSPNFTDRSAGRLKNLTD